MTTRGGMQAGGLAQVVAGSSGPASISDVMGDIGKDPEEGPGGGNLIQSTLQRARMNRNQAIQSLQAGRDRLLEQDRASESSKWLAMAQAMLAPTKTGGFGESLGAAAGALGEQQQREEEMEMLRQQQLTSIDEEMRRTEDTLITQETALLRAAATGKSGSVKDPVGSGRVVQYMDDNGDEQTVLINRVWDPSMNQGEGGFETHMAVDENGKPMIALHSMDANQAGAVMGAKTDAKTDSTARGNLINAAYAAKPTLARAYKALELIDEVEAAGGTGGIQNYIQRVREFFGDAAQDVTDRGQLENLLFIDLANTLNAFPGQLSNRELEKGERVSAGNARPGDVNRAIIQDYILRMEYEISSAGRLANEFGTAFQKRLMSEPMPDIGQDLRRPEATGLPTREAPAFEEEAPEGLPAEGDMGSMQNPYQPQSEEEFAEVPAGAYFVNPPDGKIYVKN